MSGPQKKGARRSRANPRLVRGYRSYTVAEVARTFGIHKNTVCQWFEAGLARNDDQRPILILGSDLKSFLTDRRGRSKRKCAPGEMYCIRCRSPKKAAGRTADYVPITPTLGNLKEICPDCELVMNRRASRESVELIRGDLEITFRQALPQVNESQQPTLNSDFRRGPKPMTKHNAQTSEPNANTWSF